MRARGLVQLALSGRLFPPAPPTVTIATTWNTGNLLTITPGVGGGPVSHFDEYLDGVATGRFVTATGGPVSYTLNIADDSYGISFKAVGLGGSSAASASMGATPALEATLSEGLDTVHTPLSVGALTTVACIKGTTGTFSGGSPTYSLTAITNDESIGSPGMIMGGSRLDVPLGAKVVGQTRPVYIEASQDASSGGPLVLMEFGDIDYTHVGCFAYLTNVAGANSWELYLAIRGGAGLGIWQSPNLAVPRDPCALTLVYDFNTIGTGTTSRRVDNVEQVGGTDTNALTAGSSCINNSLHINGRNGTALFRGTKSIAAWFWLNNPDAAAIARVTRYCSSIVGETSA